MRTVCAWCAASRPGEPPMEKIGGRWVPLVAPLRPGELVSHGICPACEQAFEADVKGNPVHNGDAREQEPVSDPWLSYMAAKAYVRKIRNAVKREYGEQYLRYLIGKGPEPCDPPELSYMAAQAVRMHLAGLLQPGSYMGSVIRGENPGVPHGTFAKLRRAAVRRGASDPDAYAASVERKMMGTVSRQQFLNGAEDVQWLKDTVLKHIRADLPVFRSFMLYGNEDAPDRVDLYTKSRPTVNDRPVRSIDLRENPARRAARNPTLAILGNPGRKKLARKVLVIDYVHAGDGKKYTHDFGEDRDHGPVLAFVEDGGRRVVLEAADGRAIVKDY